MIINIRLPDDDYDDEDMLMHLTTGLRLIANKIDCPVDLSFLTLEQAAIEGELVGDMSERLANFLQAPVISSQRADINLSFLLGYAYAKAKLNG